MDEPSLVKEEAKEETQVRVEVVVFTASGTQFPIHLGLVKQDQLQAVHNLIRASFETLAPTRGLTFVDEVGCTRHFNTNQITCVEVRIR